MFINKTTGAPLEPAAPAPEPLVESAAPEPVPPPPPAEPAEPEAEFEGDPAELNELALDFLAETHNLTLALAGFEFRALKEDRRIALAEAADPEGAAAAKEESGKKKGEAASEFLKKTMATIVSHLKKIWNWIVAAIRSIMDKVFKPRKDWLDKEKAHLAAGLGDAEVEVDVGDKVLTSNAGRLVAELGMACATITAAIRAPRQGGSYTEEIQDAFHKWADARETKSTLSAALEAKYIGAPQKVVLDPATITKLISVAETTFRNLESFKTIQKSLNEMRQEAESEAGGPAASAARLRSISFACSQLTAALSAAMSVNSRLNGQAMAALVRASRASKGEPQKKPAPAAEPVAEAALPAEPAPPAPAEPFSVLGGYALV